jgi:hypothetical protein
MKNGTKFLQICNILIMLPLGLFVSLLTAMAQLRSEANQCGFVVEKAALEHISCPYTSVFPVSIFPS